MDLHSRHTSSPFFEEQKVALSYILALASLVVFKVLFLRPGFYGCLALKANQGLAKMETAWVH